MKILLYFLEDKDRKNYEAARIYRNLKYACEIAGFDITNNPNDDYDIAHFVTLENEGIINKVRERNIPIVISTLMTEIDLDSILVRKAGYNIVKPRAVKTLNKASLILVPAYLMQVKLKHSGVETPVQVLSCGINLKRFDDASLLEKQVFSRYFSLDDNDRVVVNVGKYSLKNGLSEFVEAAKCLPNVHFFWLGKHERRFPRQKVKRLIKNAPKNLHFAGIVDEDIYKSLMIRAEVYYSPAHYNVGIVSLLDALAAKCQIIARDQSIALDLLINNSNCFLKKSSLEFDSLLNALRTYFEGTNQSTVEKGYLSILTVDTKVISEKLKIIYQSLLNKN